MLRPGEEPDHAALLAPYAEEPAILIAVSGGPDSMALLWLTARWARFAGRPRVEAATVDHGLRPEARAEAQMVARAAKQWGVRHHILPWRGEKSVTRMQERARAARYALLEACAHRIGARVVLTAHHADDQAETVLFRLLRGSGVAGLAGMAAQSRQGAVTVGRPLLGLAKKDLVALCEREGIAFARDPSNEDPAYARTAMRRITGLLAAEGLGAAELLRLARRAGRMDDAASYCLDRSLATLSARAEPGRFSVDLDGVRDLPVELLTRLLSREAMRVSATGRAPRLDRAEALAERLAEALAGGGSIRSTLGGALVRLDRRGRLTLAPEAGRKRGRVDAVRRISPAPDENKAPSLGNRGCES